MSRGTGLRGVSVHRIRLGAAGLIGLAALAFLAVPPHRAGAQESEDYRPILDRLDRLERDLNLLQRQVYRGKVESGDGAGAAPGVAETAVPAGGAADMEVRLGGLETELRSTTGRMEEMKHAIDELRTRLDKLVADVDTRLSAMEQNVAKSKQGEGSPLAAAAAEPSGAATGPGKPPADKGEIALVAPTDTHPAAPGADEPAPAPAETTLPQGTPMEQYQYARTLLAKADYPGAEKTLKAFIKTYPNNELIENAEYWLGETYYVRSDYTNAAVTYAEGYKKFPNGAKAPDNLLKLGLSLANLSETDQACKAFAEIDKKFPTARADIRDRAAAERKQRGCK
jgi:tol-pal system protein YbgF